MFIGIISWLCIKVGRLLEPNLRLMSDESSSKMLNLDPLVVPQVFMVKVT